MINQVYRLVAPGMIDVACTIRCVGDADQFIAQYLLGIAYARWFSVVVIHRRAYD